MVNLKKNQELVLKIVEKIRKIEEEALKSSTKYPKSQIRKRIEQIIDEEVLDYEVQEY